MKIQVISENPLVVHVDGRLANVLTYDYIQDGNSYQAFYIVAGTPAQNYVVKSRYDFNSALLPTPN